MSFNGFMSISPNVFNFARKNKKLNISQFHCPKRLLCVSSVTTMQQATPNGNNSAADIGKGNQTLGAGKAK